VRHAGGRTCALAALCSLHQPLLPGALMLIVLSSRMRAVGDERDQAEVSGAIKLCGETEESQPSVSSSSSLIVEPLPATACR
jgi:hypothetical protein